MAEFIAENYLATWKHRVMGMDCLAMPEGYKNSREEDTYKGFIGFIEQFTIRVLSGKKTGLKSIDDTSNPLGELGYNTQSLPHNLWDTAVKIANGKNTLNNINIIPKLPNVDENSKKAVYNTFMPAYRALNENFSIFNWLFDHKRYLAERDAIKGLEVLMCSLTGDSKADFDKEFTENKRNVILDANSVKQIKKVVSNERKHYKLAIKEEKKKIKADKYKTEHEIEAENILNESIDYNDDDAEYDKDFEEDDLRDNISIDEIKNENENVRYSDKVDTSKTKSKDANIYKM